MSEAGHLEELLLRDRLIVGLCLVFAIGLAGGYILSGAGMGMNALKMSEPMRHMGAAMYTPWTTTYVLSMFLMWWVMMIGMMLPSAAPTILLAAALNRRSNSVPSPFGNTVLFCLGYLIAWALFSIVAVVAQWGLARGGMLSMHMETLPSALTGGLLLAAGAWQLTPLKSVCLRHCRSPAEFLVQHRRPGALGALQMGTHHGAYCLGCCWFLMALLFVGGVMNLYWIVGLAAFVFAEKVLAVGHRLVRITGVALTAVGVLIVVGIWSP